MNKLKLTLITVSLALATASYAESVKLSNVHLCCNSCVKGVDAAIKKVNGATATVDKDGGTVTIEAGDKATAQKAVNALVDAGYFGKVESGNAKLASKAKGSDAKVSSLKVEGVHLCCKKCVTAVNKAVGGVAGVKGTDAEPKATSFTVNGNFSPAAVLKALEEAGLTATALQ